MALKRYTLSLGQSMNYAHPAPERTARKSGALFSDDTFQVWPSREAMARSIRMQQKRERRTDDWRPLVPLTDGEGF